MGRFDNVNPSALKSGAEKCISDLNNRDFRNWYSDFQKADKQWRDFHKSAIETLLQYINDYYDNMTEALDVLPPMADLIQQYKELEKELEELKREYASASTPEERESIAYSIEAVESEMESILSEIEDLSSTTVTTSFSKDIDAFLYESVPIIINDEYISGSHREYDRIVDQLNNLHNFFAGHSELGGARNNYVTNITRQIATIFVNMLEVLKEGQTRWKTFDQAFAEAEHNLERYIASYSVDTFSSKTNNYTYGTVNTDDMEVDTNHKQKDHWREGTVNSGDQTYEANTQQAFEEEGSKSVNSYDDTMNANVDNTPDFEQKQMAVEETSGMNSNYVANELEKSGNTTTDGVTMNSQFEDTRLDLDESRKVDTDGPRISAEVDNIKIPDEVRKMDTEDNRIHIDEFEATANQKLAGEGRVNVEGETTTAEYESGYDF